MASRAEAVEDRMSRVGQRLQMTLSGLREVSRWTAVLRKENPEDPRYAEFDNRIQQLCTDVDVKLTGVLNTLRAARDQGAKSG